MSVATFIANAETVVAIESAQVDTTTGLPASEATQTSMGGIDRTADNWATAGPGCDAVPCLISVMSTTRVNTNNQISYETLARIYLNNDPTPNGLDITYRLRTVVNGKPGPAVAGIWTITGVQNPIPFDDHIEIQAMRIGIPGAQ